MPSYIKTDSQPTRFFHVDRAKNFFSPPTGAVTLKIILTDLLYQPQSFSIGRPSPNHWPFGFTCRAAYNKLGDDQTIFSTNAHFV